MRPSCKYLTYCALCCALCAVCAQIALPIGAVPFTLQTFAIAFCGFFLGWKYALCTVCAYLTLGVIGIPVFAQWQGGIHLLAGQNGGFLIGFLFLCALCGIGKGKKSLFFGSIGLLFCHACGCIWFSFVTDLPFWASFLSASLPFLAKDILYLCLAYALTGILARRRLLPSL